MDTRNSPKWSQLKSNWFLFFEKNGIGNKKPLKTFEFKKTVTHKTNQNSSTILTSNQNSWNFPRPIIHRQQFESTIIASNDHKISSTSTSIFIVNFRLTPFLREKKRHRANIKLSSYKNHFRINFPPIDVKALSASGGKKQIFRK